MRLFLFFALGGVLSAGDVSGTIIVERKLTKRNVTAAAGLYQRGTAPALSSDKGVDPLVYERTHVVIYLEGNAGAAAAPVTAALTVTMEQKDRRFVPELLVIPAGSTVSFPNFDPIFHNVFSLSKPKNFDLGNYSQGQTRMVTFSKPGPVYVYCHLHPNMAATIVVSPNQWNTTADASGRFTLPNVAPGPYTVVAWHKAAGAFRQKVDVTPQGIRDLKFVIPLAEEHATHDVAHR